jgi:hypothetical protein
VAVYATVVVLLLSLFSADCVRTEQSDKDRRIVLGGCIYNGCGVAVEPVQCGLCPH